MRSFALIVAIVLVVGQSLAQVPEPALPDISVIEVCYPDTTGYRRITVGPLGRDHQDLQQAIDAATMRTVIVLDAGAEFGGSFTLRRKQGDGWIVITSSAAAQLPPRGQRVGPEHAGLMARIVATQTNGAAAIRTEAQAHHYRLVGLEITVAPFVNEHYGTINLGESGSGQTTMASVPHDLIVDHCYVHGHDDVTVMKYGVRLDCAAGAIIDSYIAQYHSIGFDAQAISGINGPGPFLIENNYLEGSGENIMFGGGAPSITGLVPSDIVIRRNTLSKPWSWRVGHSSYAGRHWTIKNLFELKTGRRVLVDGNVMEHCWADLPIGQSGYAILLTVRTEGGKAPQAEVSDVTITNNVIRDVAAGISLSGTDGAGSTRSSRILIENNRFENINGPEYGDGNTDGPNDGTFLKIGDPMNVIVRHNTIRQTGPITWAISPMQGFAFTYNHVWCLRTTAGYQGIYSPGLTEGNATLAARFPDITDADRRFHGNALVGGVASRYSNYATVSTNIFPASDDGVPSSIGADVARIDSAVTFNDTCRQIVSVADRHAADDEVRVVAMAGIMHITGPWLAGRSYKVVDMNGRTVLHGTTNVGELLIDISALARGVYVLVLQDVERPLIRIFTADHDAG